MPDIGLIQQIYLGGVITAFLSFILVLGFGALYSNAAPRKRLEAAPARQAEPAETARREAA
ncbi:hypothetical protein [Phenylobacterium sp.]|uniref:hypothetical protein n=1 Tax=Phenylobacterium sp. TaxID=1871053 RepID=UPI00286E2A76|nr:hypothetical protein [Phenylobacterium sp.]